MLQTTTPNRSESYSRALDLRLILKPCTTSRRRKRNLPSESLKIPNGSNRTIKDLVRFLPRTILPRTWRSVCKLIPLVGFRIISYILRTRVVLFARTKICSQNKQTSTRKPVSKLGQLHLLIMRPKITTIRTQRPQCNFR